MDMQIECKPKKKNLFNRTLNTMDQEQTRKKTMLCVWMIVGCIFLVFMGIVALTQNIIILAIIYFCIALFLLASFIYANRTKNYTKSSIIGMTVVLIILLFIFSRGIAQQDSFVWYYSFPPLSMFLLGLKKGSIYSLTLIGVSILINSLGEEFRIFSPYPQSLTIRMVFSYVAIFLISYVYEQTRIITHNKLQIAIQELNILAKRDGLTGLYNRRYQDEILPVLLDQMSRSKVIAAFIMADLDYFKKYNDSCGHQAGDIVLRKFSQILSEQIQRKTDYVFRYGGEEFAILLMPTNREKALNIAETIIRKTRRLSILHPESPYRRITASVGIFLTETTICHDHKTIIERADQALYMAKREGRDRFVCIEETSDRSVVRRRGQ